MFIQSSQTNYSDPTPLADWII